MNETRQVVRGGFMTGLVLALLVAISRASFAAEPTPADLEFFEKEIRPLLVEHCLQCHSPEKKVRGGLRLDHPEGWLKGGDSGPAVVPGNVDDSLLIEAIRFTNDDMQMPPKGKLSAESIALLEDWVKRGAPAPKSTASPTAKAAPAVLDLVKAREFWSYRPRFRPTVPEDQPGQPIDRFLATGLQAAGLKPNSEADRAVRRIAHPARVPAAQCLAVPRLRRRKLSGGSTLRPVSARAGGWRSVASGHDRRPPAAARRDDVLGHGRYEP